MSSTPTPLPGGVVNGAARLVDGTLKLSAMEVVLDTIESVQFDTVHG